MDAPLRLGLGHPLHPVRAALVLEDRVGALALDREGHLLEAADLGAGLREHLGGEAALFGVTGEHLVEIAGEKRRLVTPGPGPDLDQDVLRVVGVALDHRQADLLFECLDSRRRLLGHLQQLRVLPVLHQQLPRSLEIVLQPAVLDRQRLRRLQLAVLAADFGIALPVPDHGGIDICASSFAEAALDLFEEGIDHDVTT